MKWLIRCITYFNRFCSEFKEYLDSTNYPISYEFDRNLNWLLDNYEFEFLYYRRGQRNTCEAKLGGYTFWVENHPYSSFRIEGNDGDYIKVMARRETRKRAMKKLEEAILKISEPTALDKLTQDRINAQEGHEKNGNE